MKKMIYIICNIMYAILAMILSIMIYIRFDGILHIWSFTINCLMLYSIIEELHNIIKKSYVKDSIINIIWMSAFAIITMTLDIFLQTENGIYICITIIAYVIFLIFFAYRLCKDMIIYYNDDIEIK